MGRKLRNNFSSGRPKKMSKGPVDQTKKWVELWLAAVSPCRAPIGQLSPLPCLYTSPSCWGTHFLYLSNPPLVSFLPILLCLKCLTYDMSWQQSTQWLQWLWWGKLWCCRQYLQLCPDCLGSERRRGHIWVTLTKKKIENLSWHFWQCPIHS